LSFTKSKKLIYTLNIYRPKNEYRCIWYTIKRTFSYVFLHVYSFVLPFPESVSNDQYLYNVLYSWNINSRIFYMTCTILSNVDCNCLFINNVIVYFSIFLLYLFFLYSFCFLIIQIFLLQNFIDLYFYYIKMK